jgi:hypothetical protein
LDAATNDFSIELFRNGDSVISSNGITRLVPYVCPGDWDGDGIPNEKDAEPTVPNGENFGPSDERPDNANSAAYRTIDLAARDVTAEIRFVGDGVSNLPDPHFIARQGITNRVTFLVGKTYRIESAFPISCAGVSDSATVVITNSACSLTIVRPVIFSRTDTAARSAGGFRMNVDPPDLNGVFHWTSNACCTVTGLGSLFSTHCDACTCGGCMLGGVYVYEGYALGFGGIPCGCVNSQEGEQAASARISFLSGAVIFENGYTNAPNDIVPRRSTTNSLNITVYGGSLGGSAEIDFDDKGKLAYLTQEAIPRSISVAAEETLALSFPFTAKEESATENDIKARLKFSENFTGDIIESEDEMTAVRVEVEAEADWPENKNRHVFGPQEIFSMRTYPRGVKNSTWEIGDKLISSNQVSHIAHDEPTNLFAKVSIRGSIFGFDISTVAPERLEAIACREFSDSDWRSKIGGVPRIGDVAVGMVVDLRLLPDYVSFKNVFLQEGECEATNAEGFFVKNSVALLPHGPDEGALTEVKVSDFQNYAGQDFAAVDFGFIPIRLEEGSFQYNITNYWYVKSSGDVATRKNLLTIESQKYFLDINGTLSVEKYGCKIQRGTNNIINIIRSQK